MDICFIRKWAAAGSRVGEKNDSPVTPRTPFRLDAPRPSFVCIDALVFSHPRVRCSDTAFSPAGPVPSTRHEDHDCMPRANRPAIDRSPGVLVKRPSLKATVVAPGEQAIHVAKAATGSPRTGGRHRGRPCPGSQVVLSLHVSSRCEAKRVRGPSGRGARRLARAGVLESTSSTASKRNQVVAVVSRASAVRR